MQIKCDHCKNTWEVPPGTMLGARLKYAMGDKKHSFSCPNCGAKNELTAEDFHSYDKPQNVVPVTGNQATPGSSDEFRPGDEETAKSAPTNPVEAPAPGPRARRAVVLVRGVEARRDHSHWAEVMSAFSKGEKITIVDMWTDGEDTWVQLGPERWISIVQDGETVIALLDD